MGLITTSDFVALYLWINYP